MLYSQDSRGLAGHVLAKTGDYSIFSSPAMANLSLLNPALSVEVFDCHKGNIMKKNIALTIFQRQQEGQEDTPPISHMLHHGR